LSWHSYGYYRPYVSVVQKQAKAAREMAKLKKKGQIVSPVVIEGRAIATTFWGKAWCDHLESFSDFYNRLARGRTYVRNGSVVDLQVLPGKVIARVAGSDLYTVEVAIKPLASAHWKTLTGRCAGEIKSVIELLQGRLSNGVMQIMTCREDGLFPSPAQIEMDCSCPDYAGMCKHVAAVLYGVGARLDRQPELLFKLREVDHTELIAAAADIGKITRGARSRGKVIAADQLSNVFGIDVAIEAPAPTPAIKVRKRKAPVPDTAKRPSARAPVRRKSPNR
jgi:uncharacterized Zn finger protein